LPDLKGSASKSIGYRVSRNGISYLIDTGAAIFREIGKQGVLAARGVFGTHSHEDHKRWFSDMALFRVYSPNSPGKMRLITTELIHEEYHKNSKGTMERSLSDDSKRLIDIPYDEFVDRVLIGPKCRYRIVYYDELSGAKAPWAVVDTEDRHVPPSIAKVIINPQANRPRMLLRDPTSGEWVEPQTYYSFDDQNFYEADENPYVDEEAGLTFRALVAPAWHGPPTISLIVSTEHEEVFFSSDTVYDADLWRELCTEHREQRLPMSREEFEEACVIYDDINNYVERTWSRRRFERAMAPYQNSVVIHDAARKNSVVHTDYAKIAAAQLDEVMLTHTPDRFVSAVPVARAGASYVVVGRKLYEDVGGTLRYHRADVYMKGNLHYYVGFGSADGQHQVVEEDGMLDIVRCDVETSSNVIRRVDLYEVIGGGYYPVLLADAEEYRERPDGKVEEVHYSGRGSVGSIAKDMRPQLEKTHRRGRVSVRAQRPAASAANQTRTKKKTPA